MIKMQNEIDNESDSENEVMDYTIFARQDLDRSEVPRLEIPVSVQQIISKIQQAQLFRARQDINMQLVDIMQSVQQKIRPYTDENVYPRRKISLTEHKKWRTNFLGKIAAYANSAEIKEKTLVHILAWLKEWNAILSEMTEFDIDEHHYWIAQMEILPETFKAIERNVKILSRTSIFLLEEKNQQKKKITSRGTLWKSWKERVIKRPATAHALRPDQMISDEFATNTKVSEIQGMLQELVNTAMFNKLENSAIKYISSMIKNFSIALSSLKDDLKVNFQNANMYINETNGREKEVSLKIIHDLSEENEMLQQKLQDAEEKCEHLIRSKVSIGSLTSTLKVLSELSPQSSTVSSKADKEESIDSILAKEFENSMDEAQSQETKASGTKWDSGILYTGQVEMTPDLIEQQSLLPEKEQKTSSEDITKDKISLKKGDVYEKGETDQSQKRASTKSQYVQETSGSNLSDDKGKQIVSETKVDYHFELPALEKKSKEIKFLSKAKSKSFTESKVQHVPADFPSTDTKSQGGKSAPDVWDRLKNMKLEHILEKSQISSENQEKPATESMDKERKSDMSSQAQPYSSIQLDHPSEKVKMKGKKHQISPGTTTSKEGKTAEKDMSVLTKKLKSHELVKSQSRITKEPSESTKVLGSSDGKIEQNNLEEFHKAIMAFLKEKIDSTGKPLHKKTVPEEQLMLKKAEVEKLGIIKAKVEEYFQNVAETVTKILRKYKDIKNAGQVGEKPKKRKKAVSIMPGSHSQKPISATSEINSLLSSVSMDPVTHSVIQMILTEIESERGAPVASIAGTDHEKKEKQRQEEYLQEVQEKSFDMDLKYQLPEERNLWKTSYEVTRKNLDKEKAWLQMKEGKQEQGQEEVWKERQRQRMQKQIEQDEKQKQTEEEKEQKKQKQQLEAWRQKIKGQGMPLEKKGQQMGQVQKEVKHQKRESSWEKEEEKQKPMRKVEEHESQRQKKAKEQMKIKEENTEELGRILGHTSVTLAPRGKNMWKEAYQLHKRKEPHVNLKTLETLVDVEHSMPIIPPTSTQSSSPEPFSISGQYPTKSIAVIHEEAQALGITRPSQQIQALGSAPTPKMSQGLGVPYPPKQVQALRTPLTFEQIPKLKIPSKLQKAQVPEAFLMQQQDQALRSPITPEQNQSLKLSLTLEQAQAKHIPLTEEQAQTWGVPITQEQGQAHEVILIPQWAQTQEITFTPKQVQAQRLSLTSQQAQALGVTLIPDQAQALGATLTPEKAEALRVTLTPEQAQERGVNLTPQQAQAQGVTVTPEQAQTLGITVTDQQAQELGVTLTPQQAQALGVILTPQQAQAQGVTVTPEKAQTLRISLTPEQAQVQGVTSTTQQAQALGVTVTPEQAQTLGITVTIQQAQELGVTLTPDEAQALGITDTPQEAQAIGVTLTTQQAQALGVTVTPEKAQALRVTLTPEQAQAFGVTVTPEQAQARGVTSTIQQAQDLGVTVTPEQAQVRGVTSTTQQAQALGVILTPEQAQALGVTVTPQQVQALGVTLTPEQAQAFGVTVTPEQAQARGVTSTIQQAQDLGVTVTPEQAQARGVTSTTQQAQALGVTLTPQQAQALGVTVTPEQVQARGVTVTPEQAQALGVTVTPEQTQTRGVTSTTQQAQALGVTLTPQQAQALGVTVTPEQVQARGVTVTPEQAQARGVTSTTQQAQAPGVTLTPQQAQALGVTLTPDQDQALGITDTPQEAQAIGVILTPQQAQALGVTLTPDQAQALGVTVTPEKAQLLGVTLTPEQTQTLGVTVTPEQAQALGATLTPEQAQELGVTLTPDQAQALGVTVTPEKAQLLGVTLTPEQAQTLGVTVTPEQAQALGATLTPEQAQELRVTLTPDQAQALGVMVTPEKVQLFGVTLTPEQAQALGVTVTPEQVQALGVMVIPEKAQLLGVTLTPDQAQALGVTVTPEKAQLLGVTLTPEQAQTLGVTLTPEQAQALGATLTPEQAQELGVTLTPDQAQALGVTVTPEKAQLLGVTLTPEQAQALGVTVTPQQAQALGVTVTPQQAQTLGVTVAPEKAQVLEVTVTPQQAQTLGVTVAPEKAQVLEVTVTPQQAQTLGVTVAPEKAQVLEVTVTPQQAQTLGATVTPEQAQALGITLTPQQSQGITFTPETLKALEVTLTPEKSQGLGVTRTHEQVRELRAPLILQQGWTLRAPITPIQGQTLKESVTSEQSQAMQIPITTQQAQIFGVPLTQAPDEALGVTITPQQTEALQDTSAQHCRYLLPEEAQALVFTLTPEKAQIWGITHTHEQAQEVGITLTPEQEQALGVPLTPDQAHTLETSLTAERAWISGASITPEMVQKVSNTLTLKQNQALGVPLSHEQAQSLGIPFTLNQAQALGVPIIPQNSWGSVVTLSPEQKRSLGPPLTSDKTHVLRYSLTPKQVQLLGAPFTPGQAQPAGITHMSKQDLKSRAPPINEQLSQHWAGPSGHTLEVGTFSATDKSIKPSAPHIPKQFPIMAPSTLKPFQESKTFLPSRHSIPSKTRQSLASSAPIAEKSSVFEVSSTPLQISRSPLTQVPFVPGKSLGKGLPSDARKLLEPQSFPSSGQALVSKGQSTSVQFLAPEVTPTPGKLPISGAPPTPEQPLTLDPLLSSRQFFRTKDSLTPQSPLAPGQPLTSGVPPTSSQIPSFWAPLAPGKPLVPGASSIPGELTESGPLTLSEQHQAFQLPATCEQSPYVHAPCTLGQHPAPWTFPKQASPLWISPAPMHHPTLWAPSISGKPQKDLSSSVSKKSQERLAITSLKSKSALVHPSAPNFKVPQASFTTKKFQISEVSDTSEEIQRFHDPFAMEQFMTFQSYLTNYRTPGSQTPYIDEGYLPTLRKPITSLPSLTTQLPKTSQISHSEWNWKSRFPAINKPCIMTSVSGTKKPKMMVPPSSPQELKEQRYFVDVEAQRKNLILLNQATKTSGLPSELHTTARNLIIETFHTDIVRLGYLFHKYIAYRLIQRARNNIIKRLQVIQNSGKGYETQNLYLILSRIDDYQKKVMVVWTEKQKSLEQKRNQCLRKMMSLFGQLQEMHKLNLSQPVPLIIDSKEIPAPTKFVQQPFLELPIEKDRKSDIFKKLRQEDQMEAIWNADQSTSSYPIAEKTSMHSLWAQLGGYPALPMLLQLDVQSTLRKSLASIQSKLKKRPK